MPSTHLPIDPLEGPPLALAGRIVCMDAGYTVIPRGVIYMNQGIIAAVQDASQAAPPGFEQVKPRDTGGTIFPGLIELHNHMPYNILRLWSVPKKYAHRGIWAGSEEYGMNVVWPMKTVSQVPDLLPAVARYTECKCLVAGVTTSQGIRLYSDAKAPAYYRGIVRNVEQTYQADLPEAETRVADMAARELPSFFQRLLHSTCFLLHLSEGVGKYARSKFQALQFPGGEWAIKPQLAGIHCVGLESQDFAVYAANGGATVWSPFSNLLLYGETARIKDAKQQGVRMALGSDWSPSGSKNLLGELKVAQLVSSELGGVFSDREIVRMATRDAAEIAGWGKAIGTLEPGKRADLLVIDGTSEDPYGALIKATESAVRLVVINGVRRLGIPSLMTGAGSPIGRLKIGGQPRAIFLKQATQDEKVVSLSLHEAEERLRKNLKKLPQLAEDLEKRPPVPKKAGRFGFFDPLKPPVWRLALDELEDTGVDLRLRLAAGLRGALPPSTRRPLAPSKPLSKVLQPLTLDPLTVVDDGELLDTISKEKSLPAYVKTGLKAMY